jgi:hypothetical protein
LTCESFVVSCFNLSHYVIDLSTNNTGPIKARKILINLPKVASFDETETMKERNETSVDPISQLNHFCWCNFNYFESGFTKEEVLQIRQALVEKASENFTFDGGDSYMTRDSVYLKLLEGFNYDNKEQINPVSGKATSLYQ